MKHIKLFEQFINESAIKTIAKKYDATLISDIDPDDLYLGDDALDAFDKALKTKYNNDKAYTINQNYVRDNGDSWETLIKTIKSKKLKHDIIVDDENDDVIVIFEQFINEGRKYDVKEKSKLIERWDVLFDELGIDEKKDQDAVVKAFDKLDGDDTTGTLVQVISDALDLAKVTFSYNKLENFYQKHIR